MPTLRYLVEQSLNQVSSSQCPAFKL